MREFFQFDKYRIAFVRQGVGEKLLFFHGWPTSSKLWNEQIKHFSTSYEVIAIDWLGFGQSDKPADHHYTFSYNKKLLAAFLKEVSNSDEKLNLVVHDIGGPPVILWASENQERVSKLILLNTVLFPLSSFLDKFSHLFFTTPGVGNMMVSKFVLKYIMYSVSRSFSAELREKTNSILEDYEEVDTSLKLKTILEPMKEGRRNELLTLATVFEKIACDKFLIIATGDPLCYAHIKKLKEEQLELTSFVLKGCGHYIAIERPRELNIILTKILDSIS